MHFLYTVNEATDILMFLLFSSFLFEFSYFNKMSTSLHLHIPFIYFLMLPMFYKKQLVMSTFKFE